MVVCILIENKISIIVPVYNSEQYLCRCLDSIIKQTYKNLEILLIDDGSTDNSSSICDDYSNKDNRIKAVHKSNGGVSSARNTGIEMSTGEYISFIDSDDFIELDFYEKMYSNIIKYDADAVKCTYDFYLENGSFRDHQGHFDDTLFDFSNRDDLYHFLDMITRFDVSAENVTYLFKSKLLKLHKYDSNISYGEDLLFIISVLSSCSKVYFFYDKLYHYYVNSSGACQNKKYVIRNINDTIKVNKELKNIIDDSFYNNTCFLSGITIYRIIENSINELSVKDIVDGMDDYDYFLNILRKY